MSDDLMSEADAEAVDSMPVTASPVTLSRASVRASNLASRGLDAYTTPSEEPEAEPKTPDIESAAPKPVEMPVISEQQAAKDIPSPAAETPAPAAQPIPGLDAPDPAANYASARQRAGQSMQDVGSKLSALGFPLPSADALIDPGALHTHVQSSINQALASPQANEQMPFGPSQLTPQAQQLRANLASIGQQATAAVTQHANALSDLKGSYSALQAAQQPPAPQIPGMGSAAPAPAAPAAEGALQSFLRPVETGIVPAAGTAIGGVGGGAAAGLLGLETGPGAIATAIAGDIAGGALGGGLAQKAQDAVMGGDWTEQNQAQMEANAKAHPLATALGQGIPMLISMIGGGGLAKSLGGGIEKSVGRWLGRTVEQTGANPQLMTKAIDLLAQGAGRVPELAVQGARVGGAEQAREDATKGEGYANVLPAAIKGAVTFGPAAFVPMAQSVLGNAVKGVTMAGVMEASNVLYDHFVQGKAIDTEDIKQHFGTSAEAFAIQEVLMGILHGHAPAPKTQEAPADPQPITPETVPPPSAESTATDAAQNPAESAPASVAPQTIPGLDQPAEPQRTPGTLDQGTSEGTTEGNATAAQEPPQGSATELLPVQSAHAPEDQQQTADQEASSSGTLSEPSVTDSEAKPDPQATTQNENSVNASGANPNLKNLPAWARERMIQEGINPNRPLNDIDLENRTIIDALGTQTPAQLKKMGVEKTDNGYRNIVESIGSENPLPIPGLEDTLPEHAAHPENEGGAPPAVEGLPERQGDDQRPPAVDSAAVREHRSNDSGGAELGSTGAVGKDSTTDIRKPTKPSLAKQVALAYARDNKPVLDALGIGRINFRDTEVKSGAAFAPESHEIVVSPERMAESMDTVRNINLDGKKDPARGVAWAKAALDHEVIHAAQNNVAKAKGIDMQRLYTDGWKESDMPKDLRDAARKYYGKEWDNKPEWQQRAEAVRMIVEDRWNGKITEQIYKAISELRDFFKGLLGQHPESDMLKRQVQATEEILRNAGAEFEQKPLDIPGLEAPMHLPGLDEPLSPRAEVESPAKSEAPKPDAGEERTPDDAAPAAKETAAVEPQQKTRLDQYAEAVKKSGKEMTIDVEDATPEALRRIVKAAEEKGVSASTDGRFVLLRPMPDADSTPANPLAPNAKVRLGKSPQVHTITEELPPAKGDQPGERFFSVKNDRTGETQTVEAGDMTPIKERSTEDKAAAKETTDKTNADLDKRLRAAGMDPSALPDIKSKRAALKRAKGLGAARPGDDQEKPVFYSKLTRTLESLPQETMTVAQARAAITKGANQFEIKHQGIFDDPLSPLAGKGANDKVSKADMVGYALERQAKVQDVTLGDTHAHDELTSKSQEVAQRQYYALQGLREGMVSKGIIDDTYPLDANTHTLDRPETVERIRNSGLSPLLNEWKSANTDRGNILRARRELSPVLPTHFDQYQLPGADPGSYREQFVTWPKDVSSEALVRPVEGGFSVQNMAGVFDNRVDALRMAEALKSNFPDKAGWRDGHSQYGDIANPIVRIRRNIRTDAQGKKTYFLEEMQGPATSEQAKMPPELRKRIYEIGMKRAIRDAVDSGADAIGWTTGDQQAGRYDLSKQVSAMRWHKGTGTGDEGWNLDVIPKGDTAWKTINGEVSPDKLESYVGKDASKQLQEKPADEKGYTTLSGLDLKVGGAGLKSLYDTMLPRIANKLAEKVGGKVGQADVLLERHSPELRSSGAKAIELTDGTFGVRDQDGIPLGHEFKTKQEAEDYIDGHSGNREPIHSIPIPDAWREDAPEFTLGASKPEGEEDKTPYSGVPDSLMGFRKSGENKAFEDQKFPHTQPVRATWPDGQTIVDAVKGMNEAHAMERARRNWPDAKIEKASNEELRKALESDRLSIPGLDTTADKTNSEPTAEPAAAKPQESQGENLLREEPSNKTTRNPEETPSGKTPIDDGSAKAGQTASERLIRQADEAGISYSMDTLKGMIRGDKAVMDRMRARIAEKGIQPLGAATPADVLRKIHDKAVNEIAAAKDELKLRDQKGELAYKTDAGANKANYYGHQAGNSIRLDLPDKADREAMPFVIEAGGDAKELQADRAKIVAGADPKLTATMLTHVDHAIANFDRLNGLRANHDKMMADSLAEQKANGIDVAEAKDYITRKIEAPDAIKDALPNPMFGMGAGTGASPRYFTKGRVFEKMADAIKAGYKPVSLDIADLDAHRIEAGKRVVYQKQLFKEMEAVKSPTDGKPIIGQMETRQLANGQTEQAVPRGYSSVNAGGRQLVVHNAFAPLFRDLYGSSALRNTVVGRAALQLSAGLKHGTLAIDTFHIGRMLYKMATAGGGGPLDTRNGHLAWNLHKGRALLEYSDADLGRAVSMGDITQKEADYARTNRPKIEKLMESGMNVGNVADNLLEQAKLHLPVLSTLNDWIFTKLSRSAMLQSSLKNLDRNLANPGYTEAEAYRQTAKEMNELFGNLQNQGLLKNKTLQDISRLIFLAPNWTESQFRNEARSYAQVGSSVKNAVTGKGLRLGNSTRIFASGLVGMLAANQVVNYLSRGQSTFQNEEDDHKLDAWIPGGKRGFWFDPMEIAGEYSFNAAKYLAQHENPVDVATHIASNKLSPLARGLKEGFSGRDYAGRHFLNNTDRLRASLTDVVPIPLVSGAVFEKDPRQPLGYRLNRQSGAVEKQLLQSVGAKVTPAQSARTQMFAIAAPFRPDRQSTDVAGQYTELRRALDNDNDPGARSEIQWLLNRGSTMSKIMAAVGINPRNGTITPERFAGSKDGEQELLASLSPEHMKIYQQAQIDHLNNAMRLLRLSKEFPQQAAPVKLFTPRALATAQ